MLPEEEQADLLDKLKEVRRAMQILVWLNVEYPQLNPGTIEDFIKHFNLERREKVRAELEKINFIANNE